MVTPWKKLICPMHRLGAYSTPNWLQTGYLNCITTITQTVTSAMKITTAFVHMIFHHQVWHEVYVVKLNRYNRYSARIIYQVGIPIIQCVLDFQLNFLGLLLSVGKLKIVGFMLISVELFGASWYWGDPKCLPSIKRPKIIGLE